MCFFSFNQQQEHEQQVEIQQQPEAVDSDQIKPQKKRILIKKQEKQIPNNNGESIAKKRKI